MPLVVTRHKALVEYLKEIDLINDRDPVISHATDVDVDGNHVIGVLPLSLASLCATVTEIPMNIPPELRGKELSIEQVRQYAGWPRTYEVRDITNE